MFVKINLLMYNLTMSQIVGKITKIIYENEDNGYLVAIFRVSKTSDDIKTFNRKSITIAGNFIEYKLESPLRIEGEFINHEKYGKQFKVISYELIIPNKNDDIKEFLKSSFIKGCGEKTADAIVDLYGSESLSIIKNNKFALDAVKGMTEKRRDKIYESLSNYSKSSDIILKITKIGFTIEEAGRIYFKYKDDLEHIIDNNIYLLNEIIDFKRLDALFLNNVKDKLDQRRVKAIIIECMNEISNSYGDIYYDKKDIYEYFNKYFNISIDYNKYLDYLDELKEESFIVIENERCYLRKNYEDEITIATLLKKISNQKNKNKDYDNKINKLEKELNIIYNKDQKKAISSALNNNITIISGGPGTGKTTIINGIVKLYINEYKLKPIDIVENIALLAPTGRASKKMNLATKLPASTIHRYLKWNKETDSFTINEYNKNCQKLIIVDEVSMIDTSLFASLLKGIKNNIQLVLVGDSFQLPSIGPGLILNDLIKSDFFNYVPLHQIYRQSENSYIPYLAKEIKEKDLNEDFMNKRDDYNFLISDNSQINMFIEKIIKTGIDKGYNENNLQVLAPKYKGINGIDNLNIILGNLFNPLKNQNTITYGDVIYKEKDKVLQLVNDADNNVFNGDIGFIKNISIINKPRKTEVITIDFDGNYVTYQKKDLKNIRHAYAISIHKSQGSEFDHVILPISNNYGIMLYNKILYTAVSRAKKSLIIIGDPKAFYKGIMNEYAWNRKTSLQERLVNKFLDT